MVQNACTGIYTWYKNVCMYDIFENISMIALITLRNRSKFKNSHLMDVCKLKPFKLKIEIL